MSQKEMKWRKRWKYFMIFYYVILVPVAILEWVFNGELDFGILTAALVIPVARVNHLKYIREREASSLGQ